MLLVQVEGLGTVIERKMSVLEAGLSVDNCKASFVSAGITLDQRKQYHPEWLDDKFDEEGVLKPSARHYICD